MTWEDDGILPLHCNGKDDDMLLLILRVYKGHAFQEIRRKDQQKLSLLRYLQVCTTERLIIVSFFVHAIIDLNAAMSNLPLLRQ